MKLKYYFCFYKYLIICIVSYLLCNIGFFMASYFIPIKIVREIVLLIALIGEVFFVWRAAKLLQWMPEHFREYKKACKMIEDNQAKGIPIKKSDLYSLGITRCGNELLKAVSDKYDIKL